MINFKVRLGDDFINNAKILGLIGILIVILFVSGCTSNASQDFFVGNSTFQLTGDWQQTFLSNNGTEFTGKDIEQSKARIETSDVEVILSQYSDSSFYNQDYKKSASLHQQNTADISGTSVKVMDATTSNPVYLYYFNKNGNYYSLTITYTGSNQKIVNQTASNIITTLK